MVVKSWVIKEQGRQEEVSYLQDVLGVSKPIVNLLLQRGIRTFEEAKAFFRPELDHLHDPYLMKDMDKAVSRISDALQRDESLLIYGDYDVDGTTSVALVYNYFKKFFRNIDYYIPDRYHEGYGISFKGIDFAANNGYRLIIALD